MAVRDLINLDGNNLTEEDRRLLINKVSQEVLFFEQMKSNNAALSISIAAIIVSMATIVLVSSLRTTLLGVVIALIIMVFLIFLATKTGFSLNNATKRINKQKKYAEAEHTKLMELHLAYASKGKAALI